MNVGQMVFDRSNKIGVVIYVRRANQVKHDQFVYYVMLNTGKLLGPCFYGEVLPLLVDSDSVIQFVQMFFSDDPNTYILFFDITRSLMLFPNLMT